MMSRVKQDPFVYSSGSQSEFTAAQSVSMNTFGELGVQFVTGNLIVRMGVEALRPKVLTAVGKNSGGTELFTLTSSVFGMHPNIAFEYIYSKLGNTRFYFLLGGGAAQVTLDNQYEFTTDGTTAYSLADYTEKSEVWAYSGQVGVGFETHFVDNSTFSMDFGYRYLPVTGLKHKIANTTLAQGSVAPGAPVLNHDGGARQLDLGGFHVGMTFRFYIDIN